MRGSEGERVCWHHTPVTAAMASPWKRCCILLLLLLLHLQSPACLHRRPADGAAVSAVYDGGNERMKTEERLTEKHFRQLPSPDVSQRKLLQTPEAALPFTPFQVMSNNTAAPVLRVFSNGEPCILLQARKLALRFAKQKQLDLTERVFSPQNPVDTSQSVCRQDSATLVMKFGDMENLKDLSISMQLSNTFYESSGQWWFSMDNVSLLYNASQEAVFNASEVYAPATFSYRCLRVSSLKRYNALLLPVTDRAHRWTVTFTDFQIQAFNVTAGKFSPASDCTTFMTPAILMGLIMSLILLLVLAYALHMVVHLKRIENDDEHKADYFSHNPEPLEDCFVENTMEKDVM
ncbi:ATPase H+ transporting accessory protein 1 like a isoform X2 [Brachyistius frenatus]|uniref:ATPase H+ transporting accessory protein 1 like a isoform X2 n=2 Tax=Embiotocidae TaxID=50791 RepID=UPI0037E90A19